MKRIAVLLAVMLVAGLGATAQNAVGNWRFHSSFVGNNVTAVAESNRWVYYLSAGNLFRLDKETDENEALSIINDLSDMIISQVYYNSDRDYLVIIYSNSNIDIIQSDGTVVNMPELKDAVMTLSKKINDVTFADRLIYLATDFGYVVIDDTKFVIKESHIYSTPLTTAAQVGNWLLLSTTNNFYYGDVSQYYEQLKAFQTVDLDTNNYRIRPISDTTFFFLTDSATLVTNILIKENHELEFVADTLIKSKTTQLQDTKDGYLLNIPSEELCLKTDSLGLNPVTIKTGGELCSANPGGDGTKWAAGPKGLHQLRDSVNSVNYYLPNAMSYNKPFWMAYNKSKNLLYVSSATAKLPFVRGVAPSYINAFDGIRWHNVTPEGAPATGTYWIEFLPSDLDTYFLGSWAEGLLRVYKDEIILKYDTTNSPIRYAGAMHPVTSIDRYGNLWVVQSLGNPEHPAMVLPADKTKLNQTTVEDWVTPDIYGLNTGKSQRACFLSTKQGSHDIKVFTDGDYQSPIFLWNDNGTMSSQAQPVIKESLSDQDGEPVTWTNIMCLTEDKNGYIWMGTTEGICYFNPLQAFTGKAFSVVRPKVPRNDGTGYADRLMDGIQVNDIAVDGANRKWIATQSSGLFLVSSDGSEVISKFNTTNSPLASNQVYRVCCNPTNNSVYVTTPTGLYEYFSDSSPAESTYDNLFAYPNPVRPDYGGDVTITGMMEGSLVKIADASGNVIRQLKSTGGMTTWDCCDQNGEPVKTGVYLILCSQSNASSNAAVTKIAVIR